MEYLFPLVLTLLIETPIYFELNKEKTILNLSYIILMNVFTNLTFNFIYKLQLSSIFIFKHCHFRMKSIYL